MKISIRLFGMVGVLLSGAALGQPAAPTPASPPAPLHTTLMRPAKQLPGQKAPLAVVLASADREVQIVRALGGALSDRGFYVLRFAVQSAERIRIEDILTAVAAAAKAAPLDANRILLVAGKDADRTAMNFLDAFPSRTAGAVLLSVTPVLYTGEVLHVWTPRKETWAIPVWVTTGADPAGEAKLLVMWRRVLADAPPATAWTIDPRLDAHDEALQPDPAIGAWLDAIAAGRKPAPGIDRQAEAEKARYTQAAHGLIDAMSTQPPAEAGQVYSKSEVPMSLSFTAPLGWARDAGREQAYKADASPYVQIYLAPSPQSRPLFAKVLAAERQPGGPELLLDEYAARLRRRGFLVVPCKRWMVQNMVFEVSSILWPTQDKWHRWLVLSGAALTGPAGEQAAPMVHVMDASERPDASAMAAAVKRILRTVDVRWFGQPRPRDQGGRPDGDEQTAPTTP